jgi:membrane-associated phospholipid phosphatase
VSAQDIGVNNAIFYLFRSLRCPTADEVMLWLTLLGDKKVLIPAAIAILCVLIRQKHWRAATHGLLLLVLTGGGVVLFKHLVCSVRPWGIVNSPEDFSFPSGHTTLATAFYMGIGLLLIPTSHFRRKWPLYALIGMLILAISVSRLYLGAHWFTDVLGGWLLSAALLMFTMISYNRHAVKKVRARAILLTALLVITGATMVVHHHSYTKLQENYSRTAWPVRDLPMKTWWSRHETDTLPLYRIGRFGTPVEILNLQWLGRLEDIKATLLAAGWETPPERSMTTVLHRLSDVGSAEHLPLSAPLYLDRKPVLVLTKTNPDDKRLIVLRLWESNIIVTGLKQPQPLWVGSVGVVPRTYSWLITYKRHNDEIPFQAELLFAEPPKGYTIKDLDIVTDLKSRRRLQKLLLIKSNSIS